MAARNAFVVAAALALAGCNGNSSGLTGAGSMLVEVEVYKGPLANDVPIQIGELRTVIEETARTLVLWRKQAGPSPPTCVDPDCVSLREARDAAVETLVEICNLQSYVSGLITRIPNGHRCKPSQVVQGYQSFDDLSDPRFDLGIQQLKPHQEEIARRLSQLAGGMKAKGFRIAYHLISYVPEDQFTRSLLANLNLIMSEYSNQIQARVGVLDKQFAALATGGTNRRKRLPVGDYLRDASPTDVIHLFEWFDAGATATDTSPGQLSLEERVRMAQRLFGDYYWEKINEVYTSGQGDVSMAFIKNDIGNWDLKSFSNDPAELLAAYRGAADAAISAIAGVVSGGGTQGLNAGERLFDLGNRIATGETRAQPNLGVLDARTLHGRTLAKLATRRADYAEQEVQRLAEKEMLDQAITASEGQANARAGDVTARQGEFDGAQRRLSECQAQTPPDAQTPCASEIGARDSAQNDLADAQAAKAAADADLDRAKLAANDAAAALTDLRKAAQQDIREILDDHMALISMLQEAVAGSAEADASDAAALPEAIGIPAAP